ncbi:MAG TPA: cytochrome C biosynthesis protein [Amoebophilaceae bacterium]|nr:cytochrome C biosynthesis protein [Amoebophilaceae bacterium]
MTQKPFKPLSTATDGIQQMATRIKRHQRRLYIVGLLMLMGTGGVFFFKYYQRQQNDIAQSEMFQAVYYFEQEAFDKALHGDGTCAGLLDITKEYRFTQAANLAHFYVGVSYMHQKDYAKAIQHLTKFKAKDLLLQARAWALIGDALTTQKVYEKAVQYYTKAANYRPNKVFTPIYLAKAALAYEANTDCKAALGCYQRIVQEFPDAIQYGEALKHTARLKAINARHQQ